MIACWKFSALSFLWWNLIGCVVTVALAALVSHLWPLARPRTA